MSNHNNDIAIIGMSGRFPGAKNLDVFWHNIRDGVESIVFFSDRELELEGVDPAVLKKQRYVRASAVLEDIDLFDAAFFNFNPREAELLDPQQRLLLECAWEALEHAGYTSETSKGSVGVYAGVGTNTYAFRLYANRALLASVGQTQIGIGNEKDYLATRVSYKLDLRGPSVTVQTACSTSLVAVHLACQSLLHYECDIALAGGARVRVPHWTGYVYQEGGILSPDGHCRAFDSRAQGTAVGSGAGIVVLKRLAEALADGDCIHAVIKGSAMNNDGALKVGYTAPSVEGQAAVIAEAHAVADISPASITYVEAHGTGTSLGDPIEIAALTRAFRAQTDATGFCAIGSVKTNIGHLDVAAGVAGLLKTVLALKHGMLPPSLHFEQPNPQIDFARSPFYVNANRAAWHVDERPRRAGVSSFGFGGTNVHVVLEEAPTMSSSATSRPWQLVVLSAQSPSALETATANLTKYLKAHPDVELADVAYTLQNGRKVFNHRRMLVCRNLDDAVEALDRLEPLRVLTREQDRAERPVAFMFPGQGTQYVQMAQELYQVESIFREQVDACAERLQPQIGLDLRRVLYPPEDQAKIASQQLRQTSLTQPALFVIEYALAKLWMSWGVCPEVMIGHSLGEYVAACLSGVFCLDDALVLVAARGQLMQQLPRGGMLAVPLPEAELWPYLNQNLSVAAINGVSLCVLSGTSGAVAHCASQLEAQGVACRRLYTSHAFHSAMMDPILEPFMRRVAQIHLQSPRIPYVSNLTGTWITAAEATNPQYWGHHLRHTVHFAQGLSVLCSEPERILLEVGPGQTLSTLARQHRPNTAADTVLPSLRPVHASHSDVVCLLHTMGRLWLAGVPIDWPRLYTHEQRHRLPLPTYPFERQRYWVAPAKPTFTAETRVEAMAEPMPLGKKLDMTDWFYIPVWKRAELSARQPYELQGRSSWLVFVDTCGLGTQLVNRLTQQGQNVVMVRVGSTYEKQNHGHYTLNPQRREDYQALLEDLRTWEQLPNAIVHLWQVTESADHLLGLNDLEQSQDVGFHSLLYLVQAFGKLNVTDDLVISVVSNDMRTITGKEGGRPDKATILGPCMVIPQEYPHMTCRSIDLGFSRSGVHGEPQPIDQLWAELTGNTADTVVAYRGSDRLVQAFEPLPLTGSAMEMPRLRQQGVYLITGGLGGIGLVLAEYLAKNVQARLVLTGRTAFPAPNKWHQWIAAHDEDDPISYRIRKIQALEQLGAEVLVVRADTADASQMQNAVAQTESQWGRIHGVIHSAGLADGALIQRRTPEMNAGILAPKVQGTLVLNHALRHHQLDFLILCSSISSIVAPFGQVAYCAANAFLDAFAHHKTSRDSTFTVSINWDTWQEVGMAVEASKRFLGLPDGQATQAASVRHPLFEHYIAESPDRERYVSQFKVSEHWVLHEHKINGNATLPGTAYLEMARAAFEPHAQNAPIEIRDVYFLTPLTVSEHEEKDIRTVLTRHEDGFEFVVMSRSTLAQEAWQQHARGTIAVVETPPPARHDLRRLTEACDEQEIRLSQTQRISPTAWIEFGPRWDNVRRVQYGKDRGLAYLELPEAFATDTESYGLHPALLDTATGFLTRRVQGDGHYLPISYTRLIIHGPLPRRVFSYSRYIASSPSRKETLQFHITIMDDQGTELVEIEDYTLRKIDRDRLPAKPTESQRETPNFCVELQAPGDFDNLIFTPTPRLQPGAGEVEIEVHTAGLNFREVLLALGMLSPPSDGRVQFGLECAGTITAVGADVDEFEVGDAVLAFASPCFSPYVTTPASHVVRKPEHVSFEAAATIPIAFLTAYYALITQGRLCRHERVLIHAAAGGVGLAAVTVAQWVGAEIFATAGNPEKRAFLHSLGIEHVMDSRSLAFADEVMQRTEGRGVDVVLNSLSGEFISKNLAILAPYGRFLEIGVRDIASNSQLGLRPFEKSLSFFAIMAGPQLPNFCPLWQEVMRLFQDGQFGALPHRVFSIAEVADAFSYMAQAKHIGKVVLSLRSTPHVPLAVDRASETTPAMRSDDLSTGLLSTEGAEVFRRILGTTQPQIVVSTQDLMVRLDQGHSDRRRRVQDAFENVFDTATVHARPELPTAYVAPQNETEQRLAVIFQELLGIEQVGRHDDFFELGGHSLLAIQVLSRIRTTLQVELPLPSLFEMPTVAALAQTIEENDAASTPSPIDRIERAARGDAEHLLANLDHLSDADVEALLRDRFPEHEEEA
jgi:acyl transferase domain-containing protein/acyl carrier protein